MREAVACDWISALPDGNQVVVDADLINRCSIQKLTGRCQIIARSESIETGAYDLWFDEIRISRRNSDALLRVSFDGPPMVWLRYSARYVDGVWKILSVKSEGAT
jgi:hypothetical protein